jgi:predicted dehydrogenase
MNRQTVRVGIIGCGKIVETFHLPILAALPHVQIVFLADVKEPVSLGNRYHLPVYAVTPQTFDRLPACDAVLLATPVGVREPYMQVLALKKIPVLAEKPFAVSAVQHRSFLKENKRVMCNYMRQTYGNIALVRDIIAHESFGKIKRITAQEGGILTSTGKSTTHYQTSIQLSGGGVLIEKGCHLLSELSTILNEKLETVTKPRMVYQGDLDVDARMTIKASVSKKKIPIDFHVTQIEPILSMIRVECENATIECPTNSPNQGIDVYPKQGGNYVIPLPANALRTHTQAFYLVWRKFLDAVRTDEWEDPSEATSYATTNMIDCVYGATRR